VRVEIGDAELLAGSALFLEPGGSLLVALASRNPDLDLPVIVRYLADGRRASVESPFDRTSVAREDRPGP
jgi:hypothetical protein